VISLRPLPSDRGPGGQITVGRLTNPETTGANRVVRDQHRVTLLHAS